jgi:hypothetical protein
MGRRDYATCKDCGAKRAEVGMLSHTRLCGSCAEKRLIENVDGLHYHRSDVMRRWRRGIAASVGAILIDDLTIDDDDG